MSGVFSTLSPLYAPLSTLHSPLPLTICCVEIATRLCDAVFWQLLIIGGNEAEKDQDSCDREDLAPSSMDH